MEAEIQKRKRVTIKFSHPTFRDRSYQTEVWEIVASNETHTQLKDIDSDGKDLFGLITVLTEEYIMSNADSFLAKSEL